MPDSNDFTLLEATIVSSRDQLYDTAAYDIGVENGIISYVSPAGQREPVGRRISSKGKIVTPGWINGHTHSHEGFYKGRHDNLPLELWMNNVRPLRPIPLTPRQVYLRTLIGGIDALRSGTTTLCDDLNASPVLKPDHINAALQAYEDLGIRALVGLTLFDKPFFRALPFVEEEFDRELLGQLDSSGGTPASEYLAFAEALAKERHPRSNRVGYIAAPSAPQRCTREFLEAVRDLADRHQLPTMIHVQETRLQAVTAKIMYGCTMIEYLASIDFLKPATSIIHGVWLTPNELQLLSNANTSIQHNPQSNLKLGSGVAPVRHMLDAGVNVSLGTDGCGSIENANMLNVIAQAALIGKLRGDDFEHWVGAEEAFHAATVGGAKALGMQDSLGQIVAGQKADLNVWRTDTIAFMPLNSPLRQLVFNEGGGSLEASFVEGEQVIEEGQLCKINEREILAEIAQEHAALEPLIAESERDVARLAPSYRRIWDRCQTIPIDSAVYAARFDE
ncbi:MAG: amidohydrolase family protein [Burkholderiaceae bacterium]